MIVPLRGESSGGRLIVWGVPFLPLAVSEYVCLYGQLHRPLAGRPHIVLCVQGRHGGDGKGCPKAFPSSELT